MENADRCRLPVCERQMWATCVRSTDVGYPCVVDRCRLLVCGRQMWATCVWSIGVGYPWLTYVVYLCAVERCGLPGCGQKIWVTCVWSTVVGYLYMVDRCGLLVCKQVWAIRMWHEQFGSFKQHNVTYISRINFSQHHLYMDLFTIHTQWCSTYQILLKQL